MKLYPIFELFPYLALHFSPTTELPELPDFLKPTVKPTIRPLRPINDIDLPDGSFVIQPGKEEEPETEEDKGMDLSLMIHLYKITSQFFFL